MIMETLKEIIAQKGKYDKLLVETPDGYLYVTKTHAWGNTHCKEHKNAYMAVAELSKYNGDNGSCTLYTNNQYPFVSEEREEDVVIMANPFEIIRKYNGGR